VSVAPDPRRPGVTDTPVSLVDEAAAVVSSAARLADRARGVDELRAAKGRSLSSTTRTQLAAARDALRAAGGALDALLEPEAADLARELERFRQLTGGPL
jgi:hypothetical protein